MVIDMGYTLPLEQITLADYQQLLQKQNLLPGRRMLHEQLEARFSSLASAGLSSVSQLSAALATTKKLSSLANQTGICEEYLTLLRRELGSLTQKPVPLSAFPNLSQSLISELAASGTRTSKDYWEQCKNPADELFCLCDLVRINGVGAVAARAFYEAGFGSVAAVEGATAADMLQRVNAVNAEKNYYKAKLGVKDMQFCIDFAKLLVRYA
ncbi:MAG: hypothetical protein CVV04_07495 [Firmicutes bacterium HGW-Firmicutes-9]|jgi:hypothetical protein|nr:MAG: hypothetical protein CVV04_07495 [Firmicutes bacterium HGW-Firmicutes-9]